MRIRGDHAQLAIEGCLDVRSAADARSVLHRAVDGGAGDLVIDLTGLSAWDATGLGVIMGTHRRAGRIGRRLVLRGVPGQLRRLLVATRLHRILTVESYTPMPDGVDAGLAGVDAGLAGADAAALDRLGPADGRTRSSADDVIIG